MTTTTAQAIKLNHGDKVRFNIVTRDGRDYLWTFDLFELYEFILEDVANYAYARADFEESGLTLLQYAKRQYAEEVAKHGQDAAISLRPETAVLAVYSDEQKAQIEAQREALPILTAGDVIEVRGERYEIAKVTRDKAVLKRID